ncbi:MarR family winged helix-turn-helix transcriptional regulator [Vibrio sp. RC27]
MKPKKNKIETLFAERSWYNSDSSAPPVDLLIRSVHETLKTSFIQVLNPYGVQFSEWLVLTALHSNKPSFTLTAKEINSAMLFTAGGVSKVIDRLGKLGLIDRIDNPEDGRSKLVHLTQKGLETIESIHKQKLECEQRELSGLDESELATLVTLLRKLIQHSNSNNG